MWGKGREAERAKEEESCRRKLSRCERKCAAVLWARNMSRGLVRSGERDARATKCCPEGVWGLVRVGRTRVTVRREGLDGVEGVGGGESDYSGYH